jgi:flagellar biosynthesis protein FlhG
MLVINRAENEQEAHLVAKKLSSVIQQYLQRDTEFIGYIQDDRLVSRSLKQQTPFMLSQPNSIPAHNVNAIAARLLEIQQVEPSGVTGFINKMLNIIKAT